jgi:DNA-binding LacI/PurR family transcriptional regulator
VSRKPKYQHILDELTREIAGGAYTPGRRLPSEAALVRRFGVSRITAGRALRELQQRGLVDRIAGSGTFVRNKAGVAREGLVFGLIIPDLGETEIFEPICQGIANSPDSNRHALLWAHGGASGSDREEQVLELCRDYIARRVSGVFFAPLEMSTGSGRANRHVLQRLGDADIPVVLLDHRPHDPSRRQRFDLVGIDNHRAGFIATEHLLKLGARRIGFISFEHQASTVSARIGGYRDALAARGRKSAGELVFSGSMGDTLDFTWKRRRFDAFVCANDRIAGSLMHTLLAQGARIPKDVRIVGIDDVNYAALLPVPLTTVHQPCRDIGEIALSVMLERLDRPRAPARNVYLDCWLVVRESCGAGFSRRRASARE